MKILVDKMPVTQGDCPFYDCGYDGCRFLRAVDEDMYIDECWVFYVDEDKPEPKRCPYFTDEETLMKEAMEE